MDQKEQQFNDVYYRFKGDATADPMKVAAAYASIKSDYQEIKRSNQYMDDIKTYSQELSSQKKAIEDKMNEGMSKVRSGEMSIEEFNQTYKPEIEAQVQELKKKGNMLADDINNITNIDKAVNESVAKNLVIKEATGSLGGGIAASFVKGISYLPRIASFGTVSKEEQQDLVNLVTGGGTTQEYIQSKIGVIYRKRYLACLNHLVHWLQVQLPEVELLHTYHSLLSHTMR